MFSIGDRLLSSSKCSYTGARYVGYGWNIHIFPRRLTNRLAITIVVPAPAMLGTEFALTVRARYRYDHLGLATTFLAYVLRFDDGGVGVQFGTDS